MMDSAVCLRSRRLQDRTPESQQNLRRREAEEQWSQPILITFEFEATGKDASWLRLTQEGIPDEVQKDCIQGWSESFDKLEQYLARRKN
jgi:uncharacterized protein YndB with AHSA1/START domain